MGKTPSFFYPLFASLTGDTVISLLTPIIVYHRTQSLSMSGLAYAIEWLIRIFMVPLLGKYVDDTGIKKSSIYFDLLKILACLFLGWIMFSGGFIDDLVFMLIVSLFGGAVSVVNAQQIIIYEKYISVHHVYRKDINSNSIHIANADQMAMVVGAVLVILFYQNSLYLLSILTLTCYLMNLYFFIFRYQELKKPLLDKHRDVDIPTSSGFIPIEISKKMLFGFIASLSITAFFSNTLDGLVEASGSYIIQDKNGMPIELYALLTFFAGIAGTFASWVTKLFLSKQVSVTRIYTVSVYLELVFGVLLFITYYSFPLILIFYALCIACKIPRIILTRKMRIELIPQDCFAKTSSIIVSISQSALPLVGFIIYSSNNNTFFDIRYLIICSACIILLFALKTLNLYNRYSRELKLDEELV